MHTIYKLLETIHIAKSYRRSGYDQMKIAGNEIAGKFESSTETELRATRKKRQFNYEKTANKPLTEENDSFSTKSDGWRLVKSFSSILSSISSSFKVSKKTENYCYRFSGVMNRLFRE